MNFYGVARWEDINGVVGFQDSNLKEWSFKLYFRVWKNSLILTCVV